MKWLKRLAIALLVLAAVLFLLDYYITSGKRDTTSVYISVKAPLKRSLDTSNIELVKFFPEEEPPLYLIEGNTLYLLTQSTWPGRAFIMLVHTEEWDSKRIQSLMKQEELRKYFPNPNAPDGGVTWIPFPRNLKKNNLVSP